MRDPDGRLLLLGGRVVRWVKQPQVAAFDSLLASEFMRSQLERGRIVATRPLAATEVATIAGERAAEVTALADQGRFYEHDAVPFISYPYEWPAEMAHAAAVLTLELAQEALAAGYRLKDATPYNVLFAGTRPVFVDILSFEEREPGDPVWPAEGQYLRTFLLPLLAEKRFGITYDELLSLKRDGITPEALYALTSRLGRLAPMFLRYVALPVWLAGRSDDPAVYARRTLANPDQATFILGRTMARLLRATAKVDRGGKMSSHWSGYMSGHSSAGHSYDDSEFGQKEAFITAALQHCQPKWVLDVGANTGHFSMQAARTGASVIALDFDAHSVGAIWRSAQAENLDVLPLVQDIADPSPARGWCNGETQSFLARSEGRFDLVLMLALIHHLTLTNGIPVEEVVELAAHLTRAECVIEYVGPEDPMRQRIRRGRMEIDAAITRERFETACARFFETVAMEQIGSSDRWIYHLQRRPA